MKTNEQVARKLEQVGRILDEQGENPFRAQAYRRAATTLRELERPVGEVLDEEGAAGLDKLPGIGRSLAGSIENYVRHGHLPVLERLQGDSDPVGLLSTVPGIGDALARRIHGELGVETLEDLEMAAHDGRLERLAGLGSKRLTGIRDSVAQRLRPARRHERRLESHEERPPVSELLEVDAEYRAKAEADELKKIAPRRFNPKGEAWLPVLHTRRNGHKYTALFSNTAWAHESGKTHDWVVLYYDGGGGEHQFTVITAERGLLRGKRVVRGREAECAEFYHVPAGKAMAA